MSTWPYTTPTESPTSTYIQTESEISDEEMVGYILSDPVRQMLWDAGYEIKEKDSKEWWHSHNVPKLRKK